MMLMTLIGAVPAILSALLFLGIFIFIWAAVGADVAMFRNLKQGSVINSTWNFHSLFNAVLLLFRTATGDGWFDLIYDASVTPPSCTAQVPAGAVLASGEVLVDTISGDCGQEVFGQIYFILFYLFCNFLFLPLFVATLIDYFFEAEVDSISLFNADDCEDYAKVWAEFDEEGDGSISIANLRPLIDRLGATKHPAGFNTASDMIRFKAIWARVMSNPKCFQDIRIPDENDREDLGLQSITRDNICKAYGEGVRAKKIRAYIYANVKGIKAGDEVEFKYTAKVLCIFRDGIRLPNTTADLMNQGTAKQMLVAMQFSNQLEIGGYNVVPGRDGAENKRWAALAIHNTMQLGRAPVDGDTKKKEEHKPGPDQLPRILKAQEFMELELRPPIIDPDEPPPKPTGAKIAEILGKTKKMQTAFDQILDRLIDAILFGDSANWSCHSQLPTGDTCKHPNDSSATECSFCKVPRPPEEGQSVLDIKLDFIIEQTVNQWARKTANKLSHHFKKGGSKQLYYTTRAAQANELGQVSLVKSVPRGWLNSGKPPAPGRRVAVPTSVVDRTALTLDHLRRFNSQPRVRFEATPDAVATHTRTVSSNMSALADRVRQIAHNGTWQDMFQTHFGAFSQDPFKSCGAQKDMEAGANMAAAGIDDNWKILYSRRLSQVTRSTQLMEEYAARNEDAVTEENSGEEASTLFLSTLQSRWGSALGHVKGFLP